MRKKFLKYKHLLPVLLLVASFFASFFDYSLYGYVLLGNCIGWSIPVSLYFFCEFTLSSKYCFVSRLSPVGLFAINIIDVVGFWFNENFYSFIYTISVCSLVFSLTFINYIKKIK